MRQPIVIDRDNLPLSDLIFFLVKLKVFDLGYPLEQAQDYVDWYLQSSPKSKGVAL